MNRITFNILTVFLLAVSCSRNNQEQAIQNKEESETMLELTVTQRSGVTIDTSGLKRIPFVKTLEATGTIEVPDRYMATVNAPVQLYVGQLFNLPGDYVKKGEVLMTATHPEVIDIQQQFLEAEAQYNYAKSDYERQGELTLENAVSIKKMQEARREYEISEARFLALKARLGVLGIKAEELRKSGIISNISILAPVSGYLVDIEANPGKYVPAGDLLFSIVDKERMYLSINAYEDQIMLLEKGQLVEFIPVCENENPFWATIESIGEIVNPESRTIPVVAKFNERYTCFKPGMYVKSKIHVESDSAWVLPLESVRTAGTNQFVFCMHNDTVFQKCPVETGRKNKEYVEVIHDGNKLDGKAVVTSGAYFLQALSEKD